MVWTAPVTFVSGAPLTAAQLNAAIRDNMNETAPAKAFRASGYFTSDGANTLSERSIVSSFEREAFSTPASTYSGLGPEVTVTHSGTILAMWTTRLHVSANVGPTNMACASVRVVGQVSASDQWALQHPSDATDLFRAESFWLFTGLTPGTDTLQMQYRVIGGGPAIFYQRELIAMPF